MVKAGVADVEVEAVTLADASVSLDRRGGPLAALPSAVPTAATVLPPRQLFMQVGAFGSRDNAARLQSRLLAGGVSNVVIRYDDGADPGLYRVRIGPLGGSAEYDALAERVRELRITDSLQLVTESLPTGASGSAHPGS
jgi:cell division protein FtsN